MVSFSFLNSTICLFGFCSYTQHKTEPCNYSTLCSCFPGILQHCFLWIWSQTWCNFLLFLPVLPMCMYSRSLTARHVGFIRDTYQLKLAFLPTAEPHPWLSFHMCWHKLLHPHSRPVAPSHPCLGEWWSREVGYCSGSTERKENRKPFFLMPQTLCFEKLFFMIFFLIPQGLCLAGWFLIFAASRSGIHSL